MASLLLIGWLVTTVGRFGYAASTVALTYLLELIVILFFLETKGRCLPS